MGLWERRLSKGPRKWARPGEPVEGLHHRPGHAPGPGGGEHRRDHRGVGREGPRTIGEIIAQRRPHRREKSNWLALNAAIGPPGGEQGKACRGPGEVKALSLPIQKATAKVRQFR